MVIGRRRAAIAMAVVPALAVLGACSDDGAAPATTAVPLTTVSISVTTTVGPVVGGAAATVFSTLDGYVIEAAPGGTADDLLNTVRGIRGSGEVVDAVDVRLVSPTAGGSAALVVSVVLKPAALGQAGAFGDAVVGSLGSSPTAISVAGTPAKYVEGPDPEGGVTHYSYDMVNNVQLIELPNGTMRTNAYDVLNRLTYIEHRSPTGIFSSFRYTLGAAGNRLSVQEQSGRQVRYQYDSLYRLNLGTTLLKQSESSEDPHTAELLQAAANEFGRAAAATPPFSDAYYWKGICELRLAGLGGPGSTFGTARASFARYLEVAPTGSHASKARAIVEGLSDSRLTPGDRTSQR
jgi:YD repeat-containing protein